MVSYKALNTNDESIISNTCHRIRDGDWCQAAATIESTSSNTCHRISDGDRCQTFAAIVFATHCISIDFVLNGRKVMALIL